MADDTDNTTGYTHGPPPIPVPPSAPTPVAPKSRKKTPPSEPVPDATAPALEPPRPSRLLATPLEQQPPTYWEAPIEEPEPSIWEQPAPTPAPAYTQAPPPVVPPGKQPWGVIISLGALALAIIGAIIFVAATGSLERADIRADDPDPAPSGAYGGYTPTAPPAAPGITGADGAVVYTGTGDAIVDLELPGGTDSIAVATLSYVGESGFFVAGADESGALVRTVAHSRGDYAGTVLVNAEFEDPINRFSVQGSGDWTITLRDLDTLPTIGPEGASGTSDTVFWYEGPAGTVALDHAGDSNFVIWSFGDNTDLVVNEVGDYSGTADWPAGRSLIELGADGTWSVSFK
ncbi:hypothetical protein EYE40_02840 [Glaciihabitans arcticus]|uniref:Uncharacterized protein n=1 Tax=Glaciihabitans arcticus TaxID=2668039 RepID=A0A4Q9GW40_9MICO|nr:hypothetical protein [Glaciihabitans arcticus]TBN56420.1 hypothetical protein EYE40_02840 [Glaciihabitans arcticus]